MALKSKGCESDLQRESSSNLQWTGCRCQLPSTHEVVFFYHCVLWPQWKCWLNSGAFSLHMTRTPCQCTCGKPGVESSISSYPIVSTWMVTQSTLSHSTMTSSNGNIFRVTGPLCGEFTGPGEFPTQRPVTRSFDVFFDLHLNKRLSKQPWGWWFETPSWSFWRQYNALSLFSLPTRTLYAWKCGIFAWNMILIWIVLTRWSQQPKIHYHRISLSSSGVDV